MLYDAGAQLRASRKRAEWNEAIKRSPDCCSDTLGGADADPCKPHGTTVQARSEPDQVQVERVCEALGLLA